MKQRWIETYMNTAEQFAQLSYARRLKVGAVVVRDHMIISIGYNGTPSGWDNNCESVVWNDRSGGWLSPEEVEAQYPYTGINPDTGRPSRYKLITKPEVIHAEANALAKLGRHGGGGYGATLFCTHLPCIECSKLIVGCGIKTVHYRHTYRNTDGLEFLTKCNVEVYHEPAKLQDDPQVYP